MCSASPSQQAYYNQGYNQGYNNQQYVGHVVAPYNGPVAATVPAGVDGTITPVSETYEVAAARNAFFQAYQAQLAAVGGHRYASPAAHYAPAAPVHYSVASGHSVAPVAPAYPHTQVVRDTPEVSAAKAEFFRLYNQQAAAAAAAPDYDAPHHYWDIDKS